MRFEANTLLGAHSEALAAGYLYARGYRILKRNVRKRWGEVDLVCEKRGGLVFVEVKARRHNKFGWGAEAVDQRKQKRITTVARLLIAELHLAEAVIRFDVLCIDFHGDRPTITHIQDAFSE